MSRRIAIVEDDPGIRANYTDALRRHGYEVAAYANRKDAEAAFHTRLPDLAVIDIGLGAEVDGGFELCRQAARALGDGADRLPHGARQRFRRRVGTAPRRRRLPHQGREPAASARAHRRRSSGGRDGCVARRRPRRRASRGPLTLDLKRMTARWSDAPVELTVTEFWIVHSLARLPGHVKSRGQLMRDANMVVDEARSLRTSSASARSSRPSTRSSTRSNPSTAWAIAGCPPRPDRKLPATEAAEDTQVRANGALFPVYSVPAVAALATARPG